ncbi:TetR/AcrR family transcriptional regulator [Neobacillus pocheonensis]|uniref:TetR/AcrR family transcriptional regulator n=1 Tax=Neobacillus pocheonensis TaxID=363869 RepID=A0ABT0WE56_9BACI|nr:TetR/AcrR family transcriptional regulator [Neobacillus pocheonensis]
MNKKQRDIIEHAHKLFIEKGYSDTSVQDIFERSDISKGTFYKYFSSKSELSISLLSILHESMRLQREKLLLGHKESDRLVFEEQLIFMMRFNEENKLHEIIDDMLVSNETKLFHYVRDMKAKSLNWIYKRFQQIFPQELAPYLFDGAVVFNGMLINIFITSKTLNHILTIEEIIRYCIKYTEVNIRAASEQKEQLFNPEELFSLLDDQSNDLLTTELTRATTIMKRFVAKNVMNETQQKTCLEFITFISDELMQNNTPPVNF